MIPHSAILMAQFSLWTAHRVHVHPSHTCTYSTAGALNGICTGHVTLSAILYHLRVLVCTCMCNLFLPTSALALWRSLYYEEGSRLIDQVIQENHSMSEFHTKLQDYANLEMVDLILLFNTGFSQFGPCVL